MRPTLIFLLAILPLALWGCAGFQRALDSSVTPSPQLGGQKPIEVVIQGAAELAASIATGNIAGAARGGLDIYQALAVVLTAAFGTGAAGVATVKAARKKPIPQTTSLTPAVAVKP